MKDSLFKIFERVREKKASYRRYNFARLEEEAFATFFDLAQEYTSVDYLYQVCVAVPKEFFNLDSRLYVIHPRTLFLEKVCSSSEGLVNEAVSMQSGVHVAEKPYSTALGRVFPIRGNVALSQWIPFHSQSQILGMFEVFPQSQLDENKLFFLEKFTNRIGYNLHQKLLIQQNIEHIKFTNQLVADIEHNVISPNLYYRLFLRKLRKALNAYDESHRQLRQLLASADEGGIGLIPQLEGLCRHLERATEQLEEDYKALANHYEHTSLFLETLLRRDHFEQGRYVLRKQPCNFRTEIIGPLLDRHAAALQSKGIVIDNWLENVPDDEVTLFVDKGLISQVFDNFFSNALKYTQRVRDELDHRIKLVSCSREIQRDYFGEGIHGVRFNFFTTGPPLSSEEAGRIFEEGFRAASAGHERGGGHGLHFVKNVVEIHGGKVGCEPQKFGNQFYFVLPMKEPAGENAVAG